MKTKLLAFLLCLVLLGAACLMTACGGNGGTTVTTAPQANGEKPAAYPELASFLKGLDAIRKGGVTVTASVKVPLEDVDYSMNANYLNGKYRSVTEDKALDEGEFHRYEVVFDGTGLYWMNEYGDETETDVVFDGVEVMDLLNETVGEKITMILSTLSSPTYLILNHKVDYLNGVNLILDQIDYDKVAEWIGPAFEWIALPEVKGSTYAATVSSDAFFDALTSRLASLKEISDRKITSLFDDVVGEGAFEKIVTVLDKYKGTDKVSDLLADLESTLAASGIKSDDVFDSVAEYIPGQLTGAQVKAYLTGFLSDWTIDDAIAYVYETLMNANGASGNIGPDMPMDVMPGEFAPEDFDDSEEPAATGDPAALGMPEIPDAKPEAPAPTYDLILGSIDMIAEMKVNDMVFLSIGVNATESIDTALEVLNVCKKALKFQVSVTCDANFVPTKIVRTFALYADEIPDEFFDDFYGNYRKSKEEIIRWVEEFDSLVAEYTGEQDEFSTDDGEWNDSDLDKRMSEIGWQYRTYYYKAFDFDYEGFATARQTYYQYVDWKGQVDMLQAMKDSADPSDPSPSAYAEVTVEVQPSATVVPSDTMKERIAEGVQGKKITAEMTAPETGVAPAEPAPTPETTPAATTRPADATALPEDGWGEIHIFD